MIYLIDLWDNRKNLKFQHFSPVSCVELQKMYWLPISNVFVFILLFTNINVIL